MMNYFQLYDIPETFYPDAALLKSKFYQLSRQFHPDRVAQAGEKEREEALQQSALNNMAFKTLGDADKIMAYILTINNVLEGEGKYALPAEFLMEMMDLNELVEEYENKPGDTALGQRAENDMEQAFGQINDALEILCRSYDKDPSQKHLLIKIKDYYFRKKYLLRIKERMATFATRLEG